MSTNSVWAGLLSGATILSGVAFSQGLVRENCVSYYDKGVSKCAKAAPQQVIPLVKSFAMQSDPSNRTPVNPVDEYLANYGKPPREFVEFYLNPTPENARKWAATYQKMQQKSLMLADSWGQAERELALASPTTNAAVAPVDGEQALGQENHSESRSNPAAQAQSAGLRQLFPGPGGDRRLGDRLKLTYYFSANCPVCARQKPELIEYTMKNKTKLEFTCVDLTPLSATHKPEPGNIGALPCKWRSSTDAEIAQGEIRQTPTFRLERAGQPDQVISGYQTLPVMEGWLERVL